jgi:hypothetical protein
MKLRKFIKTTIREYLNEQNTDYKINHYTGREFLRFYNEKIKEINSFKYFDNSSDFSGIDNVYFFVLYIDDKMVGLAHIRKSPYIENTYWLSYLSILNNFENMGYASKLSDYIFRWFSENDYQFETSSYSETGFLKLKPLFNKLSKKYDVKFLDKETKI